jgi:hypothetical protein
MVQPKYNPQEALERVKLMMNYDLSKTSVENKKVIEEQNQKSSDPLSCVKNYYTSKNIKFEEYTYSSGAQEISVNFAEKIQWVFDYDDGEYVWKEKKDGKIEDYDKGWGAWECDGKSNFIIKKDDGTIYKSTQSKKRTTQPVAQPAQTQPVTQSKADNKQDTPDPSKPQKLKPKDSPLGTTLKDTSIPKRSCVAFIDQFHSLWKRCPKGVDSPDPSCKKEKEIIQQRDYVQRCMNEYFPYPKEIGEGNWGIAGLVSKKIDENLLELSACKSPAPAQTKADSIFRLSRKC